MHVSKWGCDDVKKWLSSEGFEQYCHLLCDIHGVDGEVLLTLNEKDLRSPPLQLNKLSDIKKLGKSLKTLQTKFKIETFCYEKNILKRGDSDRTVNGSNSSTHSNGGSKSIRSWVVEDSCDEYSSDIGDDVGVRTIHDVDGIDSFDHSVTRKRVFFPEYKKLMVSFAYAFVASWITAYTMVLVHERVPDKEKYPPLPDIFLDNIPLIPYAFKLAELCGLLLGSIFLLIFIFHKHRTILLRRFFSIASTVFLLRSVTMFVTSLSVPGKHLNCKAMYNSEWQRVVRATEIVTGFGMSLTGVETCGDYMFSGHTAYLTIFNHLITEYTPSKMYFVHTIAWVLHLFGLFFILAAHEHYSIDVFIAFYITSRIFLYYHMLANTRSYRHSKRIRIWFPLLSYFECNVPGKVPNEFEWPFTTEFVLQLASKAKNKLKSS